MTTALVDPLVGRLLDGRYRIVARVARGGMATVYEAVDTRLDRVVAVKSMHGNLVEDDDFVARFIREARSAARLGHPNVVAVFDQGTAGDPYSPHRVVYLVMELVRGRTLRQAMRERGPLSPRDALVVLEPVLAALRAAHEARIVHRDVKPENVLLADDGRVKVADFGLARALSADSGHTRTSGLLLGTVSYLAPEQVLGTGTDARADVYAAGILLFEMLTGTKPFEADSPIQVAYKHVHERVPAPSTRRPGIPPAVDRLVLRATDRDPDGRFVDGRDFLAAVRSVSADLITGRLTPDRPGHDEPGRALPTHRPPLPEHGPGPGRPPAAVSPPARASDETTWLPLGASPPVPRTPVSEGPRRPDPGPVAHTGPAASRADASGAFALASSSGVHHAPRPPGTGPLPRQDLANPTGGVTERGSPAAPARGRRSRGRVVRTTSRPPTLAEQRARHERLARRRRRRGAAALVFVVLLTAALGVAAWWFGSGRFAVVPQLTGTSEAAARDLLAARGLQLTVSGSRFDAAVPAGYIVAVEQAPNTRLTRGESVDAVVSRGTERIAVPPLVGMSEQAATAALRAAGLAAGATRRVESPSQPAGEIAASRPAPATTVPLGTEVDLDISKGPAPVANPALVGRTLPQAQAALAGLGLPVVVVRQPSMTVPAGTVTAQSPGDGPVPPRTPVTLTVSTGRPAVAVPTDLDGLDLATATQRLRALGFPVTVRRAPLWVGLDRVWSLTPRPPGPVPWGTPIVLTVV